MASALRARVSACHRRAVVNSSVPIVSGLWPVECPPVEHRETPQTAGWRINSFVVVAIPAMTTITKTATAPTIQHLIETATTHLKQHVAAKCAPGMARRRGSGNLPGLLRRACERLGVDLGDSATAVLGPALDESMQRLRQDQGLKRQQRNMLRWALKSWQTILASLFPGVVSPNEERKPTRPLRLDKLSEAIRSAMVSQSLTVASVAGLSGVEEQKLRRWLAGRSLPDHRSAAELPVLENVLGLAAGSLRAFLKQHRSRSPDPGGPSTGNEWAITGPVPADARLRRPDLRSLPESLKTQWSQLIAHHVKSSARKRSGEGSAGGGWGIKPVASGAPLPQWFCTFNEQYCAAASRHWGSVHSFFGYVSKPEVRSAVGIPQSAALSLSWLAVPDAVEAYATFLVHRAGDVVNANAKAFSGLISLICNERSGWLRLSANQVQSLELAGYSESEWAANCENAIERVAEVIGCNEEAVRDWDAFMEDYFSYADPATPVLEAIATLTREADSLACDSMDRARLLRDAAVLAFQLMLPLRLTTLKQVEFATVAKHAIIRGDEMKIHLPARILKNGKTRGALNGHVAGELVQVVKRYTEEARPLLCAGNKSRWLFVSSRNCVRPWAGISIQIKAVTARLCGKGIPGHLFRHLVARRFLRQHPADYVGVAALLHDSLQTVLAKYAPKDPTEALVKNSASLRLPRTATATARARSR